MTSDELLTGMCQMYENNCDELIGPIVVEFLSAWLLQYFHLDWVSNIPLQTKFSNFLSSLAESRHHPESGSHFHQLSNDFFGLKLKQTKKREKKVIDDFDKWTQKPFPMSENFVSFSTFEVSVIADTLTSYAFSIFKKVEEREHFAWLKGKRAVGEYGNIVKVCFHLKFQTLYFSFSPLFSFTSLNFSSFLFN